MEDSTMYNDSLVVGVVNRLAMLITANDWFQGFILNKHWVYWIGYLIILNSVTIMTGVRSTVNERQISTVWIINIHLIALIPIFYSTYQLFQDSLQFQYDTIFNNLILSLLWSSIVETFYTVTTNLTQFNNHNITFSQDIIPFFYILKYDNVKKPFGIDLWYLLFNRVLIHSLEICEKRQWFLPIDTLINWIIFISYKYLDSKSLNYPDVISRIFIFPKLITFLYCLFTQLLYWCGFNKTNMWTLCKEHWIEYEENSFQEFIVTLAVKHASHTISTDVTNKQTNNNNSKLKYLISGYLNQFDKYPKWDEYNKDDYKNKNKQNSSGNLYQSKAFAGRYTLGNAYMSLITLGSWTNYNIINYLKINIFQKKNTYDETHHRHYHRYSSSRNKDLNKLVTKKNYSKFLLNPGIDNNISDVKKYNYLLPNFDSSNDYIPSVNPNDTLYDTEEWAHEQEETNYEDNKTTLHDELWQLLLSFKSIPTEVDSNLNNEDLMWQISMWSLLRHQLVEDKRLTRSQYAMVTENELVSEVMMEQRFHLPIEPQDNNKVLFCDGPEEDDDEDISAELICPVCHLHPRNVIVWPCKCLIVCDDCRLQLGHRAIKNCICCDKQVDGYSKVNFV